MDTLLILQLVILLFSVVIHEVSHGVVALLQGDTTAKYAGRLTLNPISHIDPMGTILLPIILLVISGGSTFFGWAKPVPYNPYNLKNQRWGASLVGLAGPGSNIMLALIFGLMIRFGFGILPSFFIQALAMAVMINLSLAFFNLIPIPPLDGSRLLLAFLPASIAERWGMVLERYGMLLLMFMVFFMSSFFAILSVPISFLFRLFTGFNI
ncbi:MAG: hypothetical protein UT82_C0010G0026 [Parcubacteria group bacterium GW2011_GWB1_40_14]|nr:MAG: hypothetical protein UT82_C0010G0026 [Parcubacteria group bacterium GW2011_GWB1_40_14]